MFGRKRANSNPPRTVKSPPSQAASLAATQAFLANRASVGNLSNAAAAAALRSHTTTPTPVGQVQTKRMQRRGSVTSNGSAPERPGLLRRTSSGSMTERSFRDPPPNRPSSSHGPYAPVDQPPPVPALPKNYSSNIAFQSAQQKATRRAASVEPPERVGSPPPRLAGGRGASLDRGPGELKPRTPKPRISSLDSVGEGERGGNRSSVNFSRPMSPQNSPPHSPLAGARTASPKPTRSIGVSGLASTGTDDTLVSIQGTAAASTKKKKKVVKTASTGDDQVMQDNPAPGARPTANLNTPQRQPLSITPSLPSNTVTTPNTNNPVPKPKKKKKKAATGIASQTRESNEGFGSAYPSDTDSVTSERSSTADKPRSFKTRAAGLLMKQPSVVREEREAEEQGEVANPLPKKPNGPLAADEISNATKPAETNQPIPKGPSQKRPTKRSPQHKEPLQVSLDVPGVSRKQSLSPARSTHFSSQPEYETPDGIKHQPPARSVSPAKSALKYSPSRGHSPIGGSPAARRAGLLTSEASDTASNISDDGLRSGSKKKKSVRVSFDDDAVTVGRAASPPLGPDSPLLMSPQNKSKGRSWYDLIKENKPEEVAKDSGQANLIKPTPALPSFGSIRRDREDTPTLDSVADQVPNQSRTQDSAGITGSSSDQAIGGIIAQEALHRPEASHSQKIPLRAINDPLPPEATSVEGTGSYSDDERNSSSSPVDNTIPSAEVPAEASPSQQADMAVPSIAFQPATPALETSGQNQKGWLGMPGGFPDAAEVSQGVKPSTDGPATIHTSEVTPATLGLAEPEPESLAAQHDSSTPHIGSVAEGLRTQIEAHSGDESEDTNGSIYSDAAEDPDDLEGDGFGSINAIIESPAPSPTVPTAGRSPLATPTVGGPTNVTYKPSPLTRKESEVSEPASDEGWDRAQAYWSGLSQERRKQLERAAVPGALDERVIPNRTMRGPESIKKKKKKASGQVAPSNASDQGMQAVPRSVQAAAPPTKSPLRDKRSFNPAGQQMPSSMKNVPSRDSQDSHIRTSMRDGAPKSVLKNGGPRNSMQIPSEPKGTLQKKNRPVSAMAMVDYNKPHANPTPNHIRASSAGTPQSSMRPVAAQTKKKVQTAKPALRRNNSDSSSSFRKERPNIAASGKYTMKRTMRPSSMDMRTQSPTGNRASLLIARTASPTGSTARRPFNSVSPGAGGLRTSMRDSVGSSKPPARTSLRGSADPQRAKSPSRFGFGKSSKPKPTEPKASRFSSRFGDSSDEDDGRPAISSRFADSSDDEPMELTPVRGIPRRIDEGDSTDLEDSSMENASVPSKPKVNGAALPTNAKLSDTKPEGLALATGSLRVASGDNPVAAMGTGLHAKKAAEKDKKKRSFFGGLGSKKRTDSSEVGALDTQLSTKKNAALEHLKTGEPHSPASKNERVLAPSSPKADPVVQSARPVIGSRTSSAQNSPKSPKLQRRNTPKTTPRANDISWPLTQTPGGTASALDSRPRTSDGPATGAGTGRPDIGIRRTTVQDGPAATAPLVSGKAEKKKRFGMLRKALGMQS